MDVSFDAYGNGWNDENTASQNGKFNGGNTQESSQANQQRNSLDRIPLPVTVKQLLQMPESEERYRVGDNFFNTIRLQARVMDVESNDATGVTYHVCDLQETNIKSGPSFAVIRYFGVEPVKTRRFDVGTLIQAVGKLRSFNNRLSLISFHIREVEKAETELYELETKKSVAELEKLNIPLFSATLPVRGGQATNASRMSTTQKPMASQNAGTNLYNKPSEESRSRGLSGQQAYIFDYIRENGGGPGGVSYAKIKEQLTLNSTYQKDVDYLLSEGIIYNTVDEDHFAII